MNKKRFIIISLVADVMCSSLGKIWTGWNLDDSLGISKVLACVKSVTFFDGTTRDNPYYKDWIEESKKKQLH